MVMATIRVDVDRQIGRINPFIYGSFIEHIGRCIYDGIVDAARATAGECVPRADTLEAVRALQIPILRWPGGNFVSGYHWLDGVGPIAQRPRRLNLAQGGEESNVFGTAEFIHYCRLIGAEPYICLNMGTGTLDEAQAWVEYCNGTGDTYWANLRRKHGSQEPFGVRYWGLGNEVYGHWQLGAKREVADYTKLAKEMAKIVRLTDPSVELVGCGLNGLSEWDRQVLDQNAVDMRYHSIHLYTGHEDYYQNMFMPHQAERALHIVGALIDWTRYRQEIDRPLTVAFDEWNVIYRTASGGCEEPYDLSDALAVATFFNIFHRHCRTVEVANMAQLVNAIAPITTAGDRLFLQTIYWPCLLYRRHCREIALDAWVDSPAHDLRAMAEGTVQPSAWPPAHRVVDMEPFPYLDVSATVDVGRRNLTLAVVNRHREDDIPTAIDILGVAVGREVMRYEVNDPDIRAGNTAEVPNRVGVHERLLTSAAPHFTYTFPAHSLTVLTLQCEGETQL